MEAGRRRGTAAGRLPGAPACDFFEPPPRATAVAGDLPDLLLLGPPPTCCSAAPAAIMDRRTDGAGLCCMGPAGLVLLYYAGHHSGARECVPAADAKGRDLLSDRPLTSEHGRRRRQARAQGQICIGSSTLHFCSIHCHSCDHVLDGLDCDEDLVHRVHCPQCALYSDIRGGIWPVQQGGCCCSWPSWPQQ